MVLQTSLSQPLTLEAVVSRYFEGFNQGDFLAVAALFSDRGQLVPPFETPIVGSAAIAQYLAEEAAGMKATPKQAEAMPLDDHHRQVTVKGRVKTSHFTVNVQWVFILTPEGQILQVEIKLLASLQELFHLNRG